jgi:type I restriction enzyme, S subunit
MGREWTACSVADTAAPVRNAIVGGPFGSDLVSNDYVKVGVPVIRGANMGLGRWVAGEFAFVSEEKAASLAANHAEPGDIVFTQRGTLGQVALVPPSPFQRYLISQSQMKLTVDHKKASPMFLYYVFRSPEQQEYIRKNAIQTGVPHTNLGLLKRTPLVLPPVRMQEAIAHVLGTLDDKIELNRKMNETLEQMARALFKSWFVDFDPVRAKAAGRKPFGMDDATAALFPDGFEDSELGEIPRGWRAIPLYDLALYTNGAAYRAFAPNGERRGLPIVKIAELKSGITSQTKYSEVAMPEKYRLRDDDILFSWSGNPDTSIDTFVWSHGPAWLNQHIFKVEPRRAVERPYVLAMLKCLRPVFAEIARDKQTTGLGHVTAGDMKRLAVVRPDDRAMAAWHRHAGPIFAAMLARTREAQMVGALRDELLPRLLSGELSVAQTDRVMQAIA